jgi:hypothetical protein
MEHSFVEHFVVERLVLDFLVPTVQLPTIPFMQPSMVVEDLIFYHRPISSITFLIRSP